MGVSTVRRLFVGAALAGAMSLGAAGGAIAQDTAPTDGYPIHIHEGTCSDLNPAPVAPLYNLLPIGVERDDDGEIAETPERRGTLTAAEVTYSETDDIEFEWDAMLGSPHAIVVHESEEYMENLIACGDIGGVVFDDEMAVALQPVGDSGYSGIALLSSDDDGEVDVEVYLAGPPANAEEPEGITATPEG